MDGLGNYKGLVLGSDVLCEKRGPGVENARTPEGAKAGVIYAFNWEWALSSYGR